MDDKTKSTVDKALEAARRRDERLYGHGTMRSRAHTRGCRVADITTFNAEAFVLELYPHLGNNPEWRKENLEPIAKAAHERGVNDVRAELESALKVEREKLVRMEVAADDFLRDLEAEHMKWMDDNSYGANGSPLDKLRGAKQIWKEIKMARENITPEEMKGV